MYRSTRQGRTCANDGEGIHGILEKERGGRAEQMEDRKPRVQLAEEYQKKWKKLRLACEHQSESAPNGKSVYYLVS